VPDVSRRSLLLGAGVLGVAGLAAPMGFPREASARSVPSPTSQLAVASDIPGRSHFVPGLGARFQATGAAGTYPLDLVDILDVTPTTGGDPERSFNLIFTAAGDATPREGLYRLSSSAVPAADLFLSPVGNHSRRRDFQALVNRSV
jgi:hypothetical protein